VRGLTLLDVLFEQWHPADLAAIDAWASLRTRRQARRTYGDALLAAMKLQLEADELLDAMLVELRTERLHEQSTTERRTELTERVVH
jgi:hypothetical protein